MTLEVIARDVSRVCDRVDLRPLIGKTVLVTGASGLLGTYFLGVLAELKASGAPVEVVAQVKSPPADHTNEIIRRGGFQLLQADLVSPESWAKIPSADVIVHSAGYAQPVVFMANPAVTFELNTTATALLMKKLRPGGIFLFLSSTEVYNGITGRKATEDDIGTTTPGHPRACYIEGKRGGETICRAFWNNGVRAIASRLAMIYGPGTRQGDKRALNSFIEQALTRGRIELLDGGAAVRTYCYVTDALELMFQIALRGTQPVYNIGGHSTLTIAELAETVGRLTGASVQLPPEHRVVLGAPEEVRVDLTRVEAEFMKTDYVALEAGLRATIDWQARAFGL